MDYKNNGAYEGCINNMRKYKKNQIIINGLDTEPENSTT